MSRPTWISGDIPEMQAVILSPEESNRGPGIASLRSSVCDNKYVLQIRRISTNTEQIPMRVFTKDADDEGFSAVYNIFYLNTISTVSFNTILLFDEDMNEICFDSTDNIAFLQPFYFAEDIEFEVRWFNVSGSLPTTPETILWEESERYYFTMYPLASGECINMNPDYCCDYFFEANEVGSSVGGTMAYRSIWDNDWILLDVPPQDTASYTSNRCGPIGVSWDTADHLNTEGGGSANFECDDTEYNWQISNSQTIHGVIFDPEGRLCYITY
jgi:hypothetical protein